MNQVKVTPELLIQFSTEYGRVPVVTTSPMKGMPFSHQILAYWATELELHQNNQMYQVFTGWLAGRNEFVHPDTKAEVVFQAIAGALRPIMEKHNAQED